jgi:molecular chaperone GrpE
MDNREIPVDTPETGADEPGSAEHRISQSDSGSDAGAIAQDRDRLADQVAELNERLLRLRADYDNSRRRAERERGEVFDFGSMEAVRALLPVLDDFERGLAAAEEAPAEGPVREYAKGIELIYQRLADALGKLGLEPIEAVGQRFDPNVHHAVQTEAREDVGDNTILEQYQRGYNFKGKLLRAAMVKVSAKP